jgi:radical SAM enzyme (TIGR01210 family)
MKDKAEQQNRREVHSHVSLATESAGKTYAFNEAHDRTRPADFWFQRSDEGLVLFIVFYTQACRWSLCTGCNLPSLSSLHPVGYPALISQIDYLFDLPEIVAKKAEIAKVIVSNNGSVLDEVTFPSTALMHLLVELNLEFPAMAVLSMETRVNYVEVEELEFISRMIQERSQPAVLELAVGFEAFSDHIRNKVFSKGLSFEGFEELVRKVAEPHFRLKCYFMQKPVAGMSDGEAIEDVQKGIDYLSTLSETHGVDINMHLNPTYVGGGTPLEGSFAKGEYQPPSLADVARAVLHAKGKAITLFVGLNDEGLAVEGGSFVRKGDEDLIEQLEAFNQSQDFDALARGLQSQRPE